MGLMFTFRSLLAGRRRGLARVLVIMTLVFGVVLVHAMGGPSSAHSAPVVPVADHHIAAGEADARAATQADAAGAQADSRAHGTPAVEQAGDCAGECANHHHDAATLCLMMLVVLLAVVVPQRAGVMRLTPVWALVARWTLPAVTDSRAPSLHALGISRT